MNGEVIIGILTCVLNLTVLAALILAGRADIGWIPTLGALCGVATVLMAYEQEEHL